ncbi:hypothetical protein WJX82_004034 [Trebouxia sp. C0006]
MGTSLCASLQAMSLHQAHPQKLSTPAVRSCTSSMTCRRCTFSAGQQLQQRQQPQALTQQQPCLLVCGKLKTRKAAAKRYKVTSTGKVILRHPGKQHINEKKSSKRLSHLGKAHLASDRDLPGIIGNLPYRKIKKSQN